MDCTAKRPLLLSFRSSSQFITTVVAYAVFVDQFLFAVIIPVVPFALHQRVHVQEDKVQYWFALFLAIYGVACFVASPLWGWYTDRNQSRRTPWLIGLLVLLATTILLWLAPTIALQLLARFLQGFATTVIWTTGLAIMVDTVGEEHIGEYMGYVSIALNLGTLIAPLIGGVLFTRAGYNAVFILMVGIIAVDIALRLTVIERHVAIQWMPLDLEASSKNEAGTLESTGMVEDVEVTYSRSSTPDSVGPTQELSSRRQLPLGLHLLFSGRFSSALVGIFVLASVYSGLETVLPLAVNAKFGWTSTGSGLVFLPFMLPAFFGPFIGRTSDSFGPRWLAAGGYLLMSISLLLLWLVKENTLGQKALLCVLLALTGLSVILVLEPLMSEITRVASQYGRNGSGKTKSSYGQAFAMFNMAWAAGGTIGPIWAGFVMSSHGWMAMCWSLALLSFLCGIPTVLMCGGWMFCKDDQ